MINTKRFHTRGITISLIAAAAVILALSVSRITVLNYGCGFYTISAAENIPRSDFTIVPFTGTDSFHVGKRMSHRLDTAAALYEVGLVRAVIVTGNGGEADISAEYLLHAGTPGEDIMLDRGGINLYSSIFRISRAFPGSSLLFCIQEKYIPRSDYIASGLGTDMECVSANAREYHYALNEHVREVLSSFKAVLEAGLFHPRPLVPLSSSPIAVYSETQTDS